MPPAIFVFGLALGAGCVLGTDDLKREGAPGPRPVDSGEGESPPPDSGEGSGDSSGAGGSSDGGGGASGSGGSSDGGGSASGSGGSSDGGGSASGSGGSSDGGGDGGCEPDCAGRECGSDGCGGTCGACVGSEVCDFGECVCDPADCACGAPGWPVDPTTGANVCPPYSRPAVFFSAHPGSFAIGMAGGIAEHVDAGRDVFVEILTHGEGSSARSRLADGGSCSWHSGTHSASLTSAAFGDARVAEALDAAARLGVRGVVVSDYGDGNLTSAEVASRVSWWVSAGHTGLALKGSEGVLDVRSSGGTPHPDHAAVHSALGSSGITDVRRYYVYHYVVGQASPDRTSDISAWAGDKAWALDALAVWSPGSGRYGVERHAWEALFLAAASSTSEYLDVP